MPMPLREEAPSSMPTNVEDFRSAQTKGQFMLVVGYHCDSDSAHDHGGLSTALLQSKVEVVFPLTPTPGKKMGLCSDENPKGKGVRTLNNGSASVDLMGASLRAGRGRGHPRWVRRRENGWEELLLRTTRRLRSKSPLPIAVMLDSRPYSGRGVGVSAFVGVLHPWSATDGWAGSS